jgi:hypothetical protein
MAEENTEVITDIQTLVVRVEHRCKCGSGMNLSAGFWGAGTLRLSCSGCHAQIGTISTQLFNEYQVLQTEFEVLREQQQH